MVQSFNAGHRIQTTSALRPLSEKQPAISDPEWSESIVNRHGAIKGENER